jgi:hypothetical protein
MGPKTSLVPTLPYDSSDDGKIDLSDEHFDRIDLFTGECERLYRELPTLGLKRQFLEEYRNLMQRLVDGPEKNPFKSFLCIFIFRIKFRTLEVPKNLFNSIS